MARTKKSNEPRKWWEKPPRSSRICVSCGHLYSSHISSICQKVISRHPKLECKCREFVSERDAEIKKIREEEKKAQNQS